MRINGRTVRASDLAERRVLASLGIDPVRGLRVPRSANPYHVARCVRRLARAQNDDMAFLRKLIANRRGPEPRPSPGVDIPMPFGDELADAAE
jgi:hypothetical protein